MALGGVLIVFAIMVVVGAVLGLLGFRKVRRIRGPRQTIESVRETRTALTPGHDKAAAGAKLLTEPRGRHEKPESGAPADPSGW
ncbi:phage holin family protein [Mycobacterium malmoense]|uniref:phage holin family protein n=1 Tax=Mycobacterium malmoense TaxID=1780 RepID=UPI0030C73DA9